MAWVVVTLVILSTTKISVCQSGFVETPDIDTTGCHGSLSFFKDSVVQTPSPITESVTAINLSFDSVKVSGCKCFIIFKGKNYRSSTFKLYPGNTYPISEVGFKKVKSIKEVKCENMASPTWMVVLIAAVAVVIITIGAFVGFKCYKQRRFTSVPQQEST